MNFDLPGDITPIVTPVQFSQHSFITSVFPSYVFISHSYNQCFDVNSERKKEMITGNLI